MQRSATSITDAPRRLAVFRSPVHQLSKEYYSLVCALAGASRPQLSIRYALAHVSSSRAPSETLYLTKSVTRPPYSSPVGLASRHSCRCYAMLHGWDSRMTSCSFSAVAPKMTSRFCPNSFRSAGLTPTSTLSLRSETARQISSSASRLCTAVLTEHSLTPLPHRSMPAGRISYADHPPSWKPFQLPLLSMVRRKQVY